MKKEESESKTETPIQVEMITHERVANVESQSNGEKKGQNVSFFSQLFNCIWNKKYKVFKTYQNVEEDAKNQGRNFIIYKDNVYDVTTYLDIHPGGKDILNIANGKIVDKVFDKYHYPFGKAPKLLKSFQIGKILDK